MGHRGQPSPLTIVSYRSPEPSFPTTPIHPQIKAAMEAQWRGTTLKRRTSRTLSLLRCYLDVTGQRLMLWQRTVSSDRSVALGFAQALKSPAFVAASPQTRYVHCKIWLQTSWRLGLLDDAELKAHMPPSGQSATTDDSYVDEFLGVPLNREMVTLWRGWNLQNGAGYVMWPDLSRVYRKFGPDWTATFHGAIAAWFRARKQTAIPVLNDFLEFIVATDSVTESSLRNSVFVTQMWKEFWKKYEDKDLEGTSRFVHLVNWVTWRDFAGSALISPSLLARALVDMPGPTSVRRPYFGHTESGPPDNLGLIGLTNLDGLSDTEAMDYFIREVPRTIAAVNKWADYETDRVIKAYITAVRASRKGQARIVGSTGVNTGERWLIDSANPNVLPNAAATLKKFGYSTQQDNDISNLFPSPFKETARYLGLPLLEVMLPFAAIIVAEHPLVTPSFLSKLQLFDKNAKPQCFRKLDGGWYLVGVKDRKGTESAEQRVQLSPRALRAVVRLIVITRSARAFLREKDDDNWRLLFISTGMAFGYPRPPNLNSHAHNSKASGEFGQSLIDAGLPNEEIDILSKFFTLKQLRKTVGLQVLLDTHSERAAAEALGHKNWRPALIRRYLPDAILRLFRARWLRMFQNLILIHTSPTIDYALKVTGFADAAAIEKYLAENAFPHLRQMLYPASGVEAPGEGEFVFEANPLTISAILTLAKGDENTASSPYWHLFAKHILSILEDRAAMEPELRNLLDTARQ